MIPGVICLFPADLRKTPSAIPEPLFDAHGSEIRMQRVQIPTRAGNPVKFPTLFLELMPVTVVHFPAYPALSAGYR